MLWTGKNLTALLVMLILPPCTAMADQSQTFTSGDVRVTTIELFTSEGCSSCPPADNWLSRLKSDPRLWKEIVPMAFHVDYWDYIGWRDRFAAPEYSARQRSHKSQGNIRSVYTPGFVVDGREWRGWFRRAALKPAEADARELRLEVTGSWVEAAYGDTTRPLVLNVALLGFDLSNRVSSGENSGKRLTHDFVVLQHKIELSDNGSWLFEMPAIEEREVETMGIAAWVSLPDSLRPLQATGGWLVN